jgi:hypothetical protein
MDEGLAAIPIDLPEIVNLPFDSSEFRLLVQDFIDAVSRFLHN